MIKIDEIIQKFRMEVGASFITSAICGNDGLPLTGISVIPGYDAGEALSRCAVGHALANKVCQKVQFGELEDLMMTTDRMIGLARNLGPDHFWGITVTPDAPVGSIRLLMREYVPQLLEAMPH